MFLMVTEASHSWKPHAGWLAAEHSHHTFFVVPGFTSSGVRAPFFTGCHCAARSGRLDARDVDGQARRPEQNGHPLLLWYLLPTDARHS